eukprot:scaffold2578_cov197-Alexandrium_tamarense.AAC.18
MTVPSEQPTSTTPQPVQPLFFHIPPYGIHREARGWAFDAIGRSVSFIGNAVFVGTAVIHLARIDAGCEVEDNECTGRTSYGIRPSSFLSLYSVIVGLASSALLPLLGAIVDYTSHRRAVGKLSAVVYCALLVPMIFISTTTWFPTCIVLIFSAFVGWIHSGVAFAYLPEMSESPKVLERLNTSFAAIQFGSDVVYILFVVSITTALGRIDDSVFTARLAQSISFVVTSLAWWYSWWKLLEHRTAISSLPDGRGLLTAGFIQIYHTSINVWKNHRDLAFLYVSM